MPCPVTFFPDGKTVRVESGTTILQAAVQAGIRLDTPCGGKGTCAKCRVRIRSGQAPSAESSRLTPDELAQGWRLACLTRVTEPLEVEVPASALMTSAEQILVDGDPVLPRPDPDTETGSLGVAIDLGTTTVAGALFDLKTGLERAVSATMNRQVRVGDDVISRIDAVRHDAAELPHLQHLAAETVNDVIRSLCDACGEKPDAVRKLTLAGNTTMQQILLGIDPSPLGEAPFTPAFISAKTVDAARTGIRIHPDAALTVFPQIGGFVGGDTVAGLLSAHFESRTKPTLLVDIGTNGEIALLRDGRIFAASTAAGPAFEGARIRQGMRATEGAIDRIDLCGGEIRCRVIGDVPPRGLCGSALVDAAALLLRCGVIEPEGGFADTSPESGENSGRFRNRIVSVENGPAFVLAYDASGAPAVTLTQRDIRELQLASGAIRAGIETLLRRAGLTADSLDTILVAGGFGNYIRGENALRIGLLPPLRETAIHAIGNASLTGAKRLLLAPREELARADDILSRTVHVALAGEPAFSDLFMTYMGFPEK